MDSSVKEELVKIIQKLDHNDSDFLLNYIFELQKEIAKDEIFIQSLINNKFYEKDKNAKEIETPHVCRYTLILNIYQRWLETMKEEKYRDGGFTQKTYEECYGELTELRKIYESDEK